MKSYPMKEGHPGALSSAKLRNQEELAHWICRQLKARKLRGTSMAPPGSVDGSLLGRSVLLRVKFRYRGPIPVDGAMVHLNGNVFFRHPQTGRWAPVDRSGATCDVIIKRKKGKTVQQALVPAYPYRGTGHDEMLNQLPADLDNVCVYNICLREYHNRSGHMLTMAHSIAQDYRAYRDVETEWYEAQKALGGLPYAFAQLKPNTKEVANAFALRSSFKAVGKTGHRVQYQFLNPAFISSMRFVKGSPQPGDGNIWNGIWPIPNEIAEDIGCKITSPKEDDDDDDAVVTQPMDTTGDSDTPQRDTADDNGPIRQWFAIMRNHPVAWGLEGMYDDQRKSYGVNSAELRVNPAKGSQMPPPNSHERTYTERIQNGTVHVPEWAPFTFCHVVPDRQVHTLTRDFCATWMDRVDLRVLGHVGFVIGPYQRRQCHVSRDLPDGTKEPVFDPETHEQVTRSLENCDVEFDADFRYVVWPKMPDDVVITPQLHPDFPSLQQWAQHPLGGIGENELMSNEHRRRAWAPTKN